MISDVSDQPCQSVSLMHPGDPYKKGKYSGQEYGQRCEEVMLGIFENNSSNSSQ